jgi:hypothetical protein
MALETRGGGRVRAWVLVRARDPEKVVQRIYEMLRYEGGDEFVVVRADVVDYSHNIVVPVDAESEKALMGVVDVIKGVEGVEKQTATVVPVKMHVPYPPHIANGYIHAAELEAQLAQDIEIEEGLKPGRQAASPGHNAWG